MQSARWTRRYSPQFAILGCVVAVLFAAPALGALVTTTGSDGFGASSFNSAGVWSDGLAPHAGETYQIVTGHRVRTPADGGSYTFAGDSLTISNDPNAAIADPALFGLSYKGTGNTGTITVDNLILDNGSINHINGSGDIFNLDGGLTMASDSVIWARQGPIYIYSDISGSGQITAPATNTIDCKLWIGSSANTFTGDIVNNGRLGLLDDANLYFVIGASGVNNSVTSPGGQQHFTIDGDFVFDLSGAGTTLGDSWSIIGTTPESTYYGSTFTVTGFTALGDDNTWIQQIDASPYYYAFDQSTGVLSVVPEPASIVLLALGGLAMSRRRR